MKQRTGLIRHLPKQEVVFQAQLSQSEVNAIINTYGDLLDKDQWFFINEGYKKKKGKKLFAAIKTVSIKYITFDECSHPSILQDIQVTSFPRLISLSLNGNKIVSIEQLQLMPLPLLKNLNLRDNELTSLRSLRRCGFQLEFLDLRRNKLIDMSGLKELDLTHLSALLMSNNPIHFDWSITKWQIKYVQSVEFKTNKNINERMFGIEGQIGRVHYLML